MWAGCDDVQLNARVSLLPHALGDVRGHIRSTLLSLRMRYHLSIGGVILEVPKVRLAPGRACGKIIGTEPQIHFDLITTARVFRPTPGLRLVGEVKKVSATHISLLVYGLFNASIVAGAMGARFRFDKATSTWKDQQDGKEIGIDAALTFAVVRVHQADPLISIDGELIGLASTTRSPKLLVVPDRTPEMIKPGQVEIAFAGGAPRAGAATRGGATPASKRKEKKRGRDDKNEAVTKPATAKVSGSVSAGKVAGKGKGKGKKEDEKNVGGGQQEEATKRRKKKAV